VRARFAADGTAHAVAIEGVAFIASDEAEQVAVASEELVQPSMAPVRMACAAPKACATLFQMRFSQITLGSSPDPDDTSFGDFIAEHADASDAPRTAKPAVPNPRRALRGGDFTGAEVKDLIAAAAKLDRLPFSTAARERHWQSLCELAGVTAASN
jgi:hypothetical protein